MSTKLRTIQALAVGLCLLAPLVVPIHARAAASVLDEQIIADAYVYLIGRALVVRQEHLDVAAQGGYNVAFHNRLGSADFVNPNLGVANTEAWIAVDDATPVLLELPKIEGRYYTAQILDEWGETLTNIHERNYPLQPYGKFAFVAPGSRVAIPDDAVRIELRSQKAKMLARVELQNDPGARARAGRRRARGELAADGAREVVLPELAHLCPEGDRQAGKLVSARGLEA